MLALSFHQQFGENILFGAFTPTPLCPEKFHTVQTPLPSPRLFAAWLPNSARNSQSEHCTSLNVLRLSTETFHTKHFSVLARKKWHCLKGMFTFIIAPQRFSFELRVSKSNETFVCLMTFLASQVKRTSAVWAIHQTSVVKIYQGRLNALFWLINKLIYWLIYWLIDITHRIDRVRNLVKLTECYIQKFH